MDTGPSEDPNKPDPQEKKGDHIQVGDVKDSRAVAIGAGAMAVGDGATVVGPGGSLSVQTYHISGDMNIAGDVQIVAEDLPIPAPPTPEQIPQSDGFVGREAELGHFSEMLRTAHLAVISGMAGVGKTSLAAVLAQRVAPADKIFWHTFHQGEGVEAIIWQLAGFLARSGHEDLWQLLQRTRLTRGKLPPTATLLDYVLQMLRGGNYLLCLDDLHLVEADPQMNLFVERARVAVLAGELSLIITSRHLPEYVTVVETAFIDGLTVEATQQLLVNRGVELDPELTIRLQARTHGNAELLTLAIDMLRQTRNPERLLDNLAEARDVERFLLSEIDAHLADFEPDVMRAVSVLNLFGHMGTRYAIAAILDGQNVRRVLRDLSDRFLLIVRSHVEGSEYGQHALVQAFYYDALNRRQREALHRLAGRFYLDEEPDPMRGIIHFVLAGDIAHAVPIVTDNLWTLLNLGHSPALRDILERIEPRQLAQADWYQVRLALGEVYTFLGETEAAQTCYQELLSLLAAQPDSPLLRGQRVRVFLALGELLQNVAPSEAMAWLKHGLAEEVAIPPLEEAGLYIRLGTVHMWLGDFSEAKSALEKGVTLLPAGHSQLRTTALENLGVIAVNHAHNLEEGIALTLEALQISQAMGDHFQRAEILNSLGSYLFSAGRWSEALSNFEQALAIGETIGSEKVVAIATTSLGNALIYRGDDAVAERHLARGLQLARKTNLIVLECICLLNLVELQLRQAQWAAARETLGQAEAANGRLEDPWNELIIRRGYAQIHHASGALEEARAEAQQALELAGQHGDGSELGQCHRVLAQILLSLGLDQAAWDLFARSFSVLSGEFAYEAACTQLAWGGALIAHDKRMEGITLIEEAERVFDRLGARRELHTARTYLKA